MPTDADTKAEASQLSDVAPVSTGNLIALSSGPLIVIRPSRNWVQLNLLEFWRHRELLYFLTWRDVKVRYKQTLLGAAWAVLQPLLTMLIFTIFFGRLAKVPSDGIAYPLFAYAGLLPWTFFANAVTNSSNSLVASSNLITKVYFPRMIVPSAAIGAGLVDYGLSFAILAGLMVYYKTVLSWQLLLLLPLTLLTTLLALGIGMWMSALNVKYRDIRYALPFFIQIWMFASPIIYPMSLMPAKWRWLIAFNPMSGLIEGYRASLFGRPIPWDLLGISLLASVAMLVYAAFYFRSVEKTFADIV